MTNSAITPRLTVYSDNGLIGITSYTDGNPTVVGHQTTRRLILELDESPVQNHPPIDPIPSGNDWNGLAFGQLIESWFYPAAGLDTTNLATQWVPAPGAAALLGVAGVVGGRQRRRR